MIVPLHWSYTKHKAILLLTLMFQGRILLEMGYVTFYLCTLCRRVHVHLTHRRTAPFSLLSVHELVSPMDHPNSRTKWTLVGLKESRWARVCLSDLRNFVKCHVAVVAILTWYQYLDEIQVFCSHSHWFWSTPATGKSFFPVVFSYSLRNMCPQ